MPALAFGSGGGYDCTTREAVEQWLGLGGRHIDTAWGYGTQGEVGEAIRVAGVPREELFLTSKVPPIGRRAIDLVKDGSLSELGVEYLDLVLIHWPCTNTYENRSSWTSGCTSEMKEERLETWKALMELQQNGTIRAIGVSNFDDQQVAELLRANLPAPAVNQVEWHLGYHNESLNEIMRSWNVTLASWGSLVYSDVAAGVSLNDPRLHDLATKYNISAAQLSLRWSVQKGIAPVTFTCGKEHALEDLNAFRGRLVEEDIEYLD